MYFVRMENAVHAYASTVLGRARVGHIGVISEGRPYVTPISFVHRGETVYLRMGPGRRLRAIEETPDVSLEVSLTSEDGQSWESVIVAGTAQIVTDNREVTTALGLLLDKYREQHIGLAWVVPDALPGPAEIVRIVATEITVRSSGRGFGPALRPGRL
jgi:nitroimidazol reductase NimA-like FMN-containing flavoprotein (pyridoxamine 5'-phosphate oxidase superfamily)